jgi:hypothetical protein
MWRSKKFIIAAVLVAVVLVGSIGGAVLANGGDSNEHETMLARMAEILGIDKQDLEDAFAEAQGEIRAEILQDLVDQGRITQGEADQYSEWWQSRPEGLSGFGPHGHRGFRGSGGCFGWGGMHAPATDTSFAY